jgi:hypothetical protein
MDKFKPNLRHHPMHGWAAKWWGCGSASRFGGWPVASGPTDELQGRWHLPAVDSPANCTPMNMVIGGENLAVLLGAIFPENWQ